MKFTNFDMRMFEQARLEAEKSDFKQFNIGAVIVYGHKIIGRGCNSTKSHPMQKKYNKKYRVFNDDGGKCVVHSLHAEIAALNNVPYTTGIQIDWSKVKVYVYRISKGSKLGYACSKPCPACTNALRDFGIKKIYHTDDLGYSYLELNV